MGVQLRDAHAVGHTSTTGAPSRPQWRGGRLGIMGGSRRRHSAEREVRKEPSPAALAFAVAQDAVDDARVCNILSKAPSKASVRSCG
jgi:hypothetical protein